MTRETNADQVIVAGAGLAGLAAAATAARAGARVIILDEKSPGGRARTDTLDGFRFNRGPHAIYAGGAGRKVLGRLGARPATHVPPLRGARVLADGALRSPLSRHVLGARAAAQLTAVFTRFSLTDNGDCRRVTARDWIASLDLTPKAAAMLEFAARVTSYVADMDAMPADVAIGQLRIAWRAVGYPDEGWQAIVDGLVSAATVAGAELRPNTPVTGIGGEPGAWRVRTLSGEEFPAAAVVIATGTPASARRLLPGSTGPGGHGLRSTGLGGSSQNSTGSDASGPDSRSLEGSGSDSSSVYGTGSDGRGGGPDGHGWEGLGPEVTAACLDLGVRHTRTRLAFGVDEPLYLSPHAPGGNLAPAGMGMVHVARYGATTAAADRARLEEFAASAGISPGDVAASRFLPKMTVATALPAVGSGLAGRPPVAVDGAAGLFVAGDWTGSVGWLSDASLASGERAGQLAAEAVSPAGRRAVTRGGDPGPRAGTTSRR